MKVPIRPIAALLLVFFTFESYRVSTIVAPIMRMASLSRQQERAVVNVFLDEEEKNGMASTDSSIQEKLDENKIYEPADSANGKDSATHDNDMKEETLFKASHQAPIEQDGRAIHPDVDPMDAHKVEYVARKIWKGDVNKARANNRKIWAEEWSSLGWVRNQTMLAEAHQRQLDFLADPQNYRPRPLFFRPILPGMGWGNLMYDISNHLSFALMLRRPFVMMLDKKDAGGKLGWDETSFASAVLRPRVIDWRWKRTGVFDLFPPGVLSSKSKPDEILHVSCRAGYPLHELCGGDQEKGNLESVFAKLREEPDRILYSEYSASFIMPFQNAPSVKTFYRDQVIPLKNNNMHWMGAQMRLAFNLLFQINSTFRRDRVLPHLQALTINFSQAFVTTHVRTGHMETGVARDMSLESDSAALKSCSESDGDSSESLRNGIKQKRMWLLLTDHAALAEKARDSWGAYVTVSKVSCRL